MLRLDLRMHPAYGTAAGAMAGTSRHGVAPRTMAPAESWAPVSYTVNGTGPNGEVFSRTLDSAEADFRLSPGLWEFAVKAYAASSREVAGATGSGTLEAGRQTAVTMDLLPLAGTGTVTLRFDSNFVPPEGSRIRGSLAYSGFPGDPEGSARQPLRIDMPFSKTTFGPSEVPAGFYTLALELADGVGAVSGMTETVLVLDGFDTSGVCSFELGEPRFTVEIVPRPVAPLDGMVVSAFRVTSRSRPLAAVASAMPGSRAMQWYLNGSAMGSSLAADDPGGPLGAATAALVTMGLDELPAMNRIDLVLSGTDGNSGSARGLFEFGEGPSGDGWSWRSTYDARSATSPSLRGTASTADTGTGMAAPVRAVAASANGLVAVAGMDGDSALHVFASAGTRTFRSPDGLSGPVVLPPGSGLVRLWRDEVRIDGTLRTPDRLAVSDDGTWIAAASSSSSWLRICRLDGSGSLLSVHDTVFPSSGPSQLSNLRDLEFLKDGKGLLILGNSPETVALMDLPLQEAGSPALGARLPLDPDNATTQMSLHSLAVAADGTIFASAPGISRILVIAREGSGLAVRQVLEKAGMPPAFNKPGSLCCTEDASTLYALCDGTAVIRFVRGTAGAYLPEDTFVLPPGASGSTGIQAGVAGPPERPVSCLVATGSSSAAFFRLSGEGGAVVSGEPLYDPAVAALGIAGAAGGSFGAREFFLAGGLSGKLSVFGMQ